MNYLWVVPHARRNPPMLFGNALCQTEPCKVWLLARLEGTGSVEAAWGAGPRTVACSVHRPGRSAWRELPRCPLVSGARDGSTSGRGEGGQGVGDRAANTPPPRWTSEPRFNAG